MASVSTNTKDIRYLNKDFTDFKAALIEYAKAYFPTTYNDFTAASPGTMFIEMAAYVGDVLSFYLDNQLQETFLQYAKQKNNLFTLAYMLGYKPKVISAATVDLDVYQIVPASGSSGNYDPDYNYALIINEGMRIASSVNNSLNFYVPEKINFTVSSSLDPIDISVYSVDSNGDPTYYLLKKTIKATSGEVKTATFDFGAAEKFPIVTIEDTNIVEVVDVKDSDGNKWYEVPYLAQDTIIEAVDNVSTFNPDYVSAAGLVPYMINLQKVPRRFATRFKTDNTLELQFGAGINTVSDEAVIPNPNMVGFGTIDSLSKLNTAYDPANFTTTETYGLAPINTTLTVSYLAGGGAQANVPSNQLTTIIDYTYSFFGGLVDSIKGTQVLQSIAVNNPTQAVGGGDGDSIEQLRLNTLNQYPSQMRIVTLQDYLAATYNMPAKFGQIAKAYVMKDDIVFRQSTGTDPDAIDPLAASIYILTYDINKNLLQPPPALKQNLRTYISQYRMLTDSINIKSAFVINIGVSFEIVLRPNYTSRDVLAQCLVSLKDYFDISKWQINQPIILSELYTLLDQVVGVQTIQKVSITNNSGEASGYSKFSYDIPGATLNGVIYPSLDPSIFEVKYPDTDIQGKVVTF
jgi:hypothetical protein